MPWITFHKNTFIHNLCNFKCVNMKNNSTTLTTTILPLSTQRVTSLSYILTALRSIIMFIIFPPIFLHSFTLLFWSLQASYCNFLHLVTFSYYCLYLVLFQLRKDPTVHILFLSKLLPAFLIFFLLPWLFHSRLFPSTCTYNIGFSQSFDWVLLLSSLDMPFM